MFTDQQLHGYEAAEERRERLRSLIDRLEAALAEPPRRDPATWCADVRSLACEFEEEFERHVAGTEGPGGLFEEVLATAPRLSSDVERLREEHRRLPERLDLLQASVDPADADIAGARAAGLDLLTALVLHRQHGADLLYEAYWVDVGGLSG